MAKPSGKADDPAIIRKYANRRLYDTDRSAYVTLGDLAAMVRDGVDFVVVDAKSGDDITRSVLAQIILEQDAKGEGLLPEGFLRGLIRLYDDGLRKLLPGYLELSLDEFVRHQDEFRRRLGDSFETLFPVPGFQEMAKRNLDIVRAMARPFADGGRPARGAPSEDVSELRRELDRMRERLDSLDREGRG